MRRISAVLLRLALGILMCCLVGGKAMAHPPSTVDLAYDSLAKQLKVSGNHDVKDAAKHRISLIEIFVNDQKVTEQTFDKQKDDKTYEGVFPLEVKDGDKVVAKATCNKFGSKKGNLVLAPAK